MFITHPGSTQEEPASVNLPLQEGDTLTTQNGVAEVEFESGGRAQIAENSILQFTRLDVDNGNRRTELTLKKGTGTFSSGSAGGETFSVVTPTLNITIPERAEFRAEAFSDGAAVEVSQGTASVKSQKGATTLDKGQSVAVRSADFDHRVVERLAFPDRFDQWLGNLIQSANSPKSSSPTQPPPSYNYGPPYYYGLSQPHVYGDWVDTTASPGYGLAWRPYSGNPDAHPYANGVWRLDSNLGWIWVSNEPGGWVQTPGAGTVLLPKN